MISFTFSYLKLSKRLSGVRSLRLLATWHSFSLWVNVPECRVRVEDVERQHLPPVRGHLPAETEPFMVKHPATSRVGAVDGQISCHFHLCVAT